MTSTRNEPTGADGQSGLFLLFPTDRRPDSARIARAVAGLPRISVSHLPEAPRSAPDDTVGPRWVELLADGMTFDLCGLAPGDAAELPDFLFRFDIAMEMQIGRVAALRLVPGPHLSGGARTMPVIRAQMGLAAQLAEALPDLAAIGWEPSLSLIGPAFFRSTVESWLQGGPFPALGLTAFRDTLDGGLQSVGLSQFTGQELRLEPALVNDRASATRLGVRLVNLLVGTGRIEGADRITGPDGGILRLEPSVNGKFVRVFPG